jgi:hypothetical protein
VRSLLNSGWTVMVMMLSGTYLLGFAGTAMAEDYPPSGPATEISDQVCMGVGTPENPTSCTHYNTQPCQDTINDPNFDDIRPLRWVKRTHHRFYGVCQIHINSFLPCWAYQNYPCAKLRIWSTGAQCADDDTSYQTIIITKPSGCTP